MCAPGTIKAASVSDSPQRNGPLVLCDQCNTPLFSLKGGMLIVKGRHHGDPHVTVLALDDLARVANGDRDPDLLKRVHLRE